MAPSINGINIPASVRDVGNYIPTPYTEITNNGLGATVTAGLASVTWTFNSLEKTGFVWIATTLMAGANFLSCPAVLPDDLDNEISYSSVIVRRPTFNRRANGLYIDVQWRIDTMVKA